MTRFDTLPKLKVDINLQKFLVIVVTVFTFFILPAEGLTLYQNGYFSAPKTAQVAGINTVKGQNSSSEFLKQFDDFFNKSNENQVLIIVGAIILGISVIVIIYLLVDNWVYRSRK